MIGVFKSSNGQFFLAWWWPPSKVLGGTQCLDCLLLLLKEFFIPFKPIYLVAKYFSSHLSLAKKYSVQMEPIYQKHTEPLSHPSKKVHSGWKKVNKTFKIQEWEHFNFWWPFGQFWNIVRRGLLIIQCVISALLIFRASDIFLPDRSACSWPEAISYAPPTVSRNSLTAFHIFQPWSFLKPT